MDATLREACAAGLELCARDAGVVPDRVRVLRVSEHYKSRQIYVSARGDAPTHVIKWNTLAWEPEREHRGYAFVARAMAGSDPIGAIRPVGCVEEPALLVTAYQPGSSLRPRFDAAARRDAALPRAREAARRIAAWSARLRRFEPERSGGQDAQALLADLRRFAEEIRMHLGTAAGGEAQRGVAAAEGLVAVLPHAASERLAWRFATHGDLAPQNFLEDDDARLYAVDLESFCFAPLHPDLAMFRDRLERYGLRGTRSRRRALALWQAFLDETLRRAPEDEVALLAIAYLRRLLAHLAWVRNPVYLAKAVAPPSLVDRLRLRLWLRARLRWLHGLPPAGDTDAIVERFRHAL